MCRVLLFLCLLLGVPTFARAAWIDPNSWSISVDGTASGPIDTDSFQQIDNVTREFGTRSVAGIANALGTGPGGMPDGTQSSASAEATVTAGQIAFRSEMDFDHGTALGYSSDARAQALFRFEVTQTVVTNLELVAEARASSCRGNITRRGGSYRVGGAGAGIRRRYSVERYTVAGRISISSRLVIGSRRLYALAWTLDRSLGWDGGPFAF